MSAKFLGTAFTEDGTEFEKQVGCITGIFQIFDRQNLLAGRRSLGRQQARKRLPPPAGNGVSKTENNSAVLKPDFPQAALEKNLSKSLTENSSLSIESSRASCSSSSCSSFSSFDCNKTLNQELPPISERVHSEDKSSKYLSESEKKSSAFRDIVKHSFNRDTQPLSVKVTSKNEKRKDALKHADSPRPILLSKSTDGTYVIGVDRSRNLVTEVPESCRPSKSKVNATPSKFSQRELKNASASPSSREYSRFSFDGRDLLRSSGDGQDHGRSSGKLRELPRLSLDSRKESLRKSNKDLNVNHQGRTFNALNLHQESPSNNQSHSVITKLMGLETFAEDKGDNKAITTKQMKDIKDGSHLCPLKIIDNYPIMQKINQLDLKVKSSPKGAESVPSMMQVKGTTQDDRPQFQQVPEQVSVYAEVERRLEKVQLQELNKDLRALKHVLHAINSKEQLETKKDEQLKSLPHQHVSNQGRLFQTPVHTRPKIQESFVCSSFSSVPMAPPRNLHGLQISLSEKGSKPYDNSPKVAEQSPVASYRNPTNVPSQGKTKYATSPKASSTLSPMPAQRKAELEKKSRPSSPSMKSNKIMKNSSNESISPRTRLQTIASRSKNKELEEQNHHARPSQEPNSATTSWAWNVRATNLQAVEIKTNSELLSTPSTSSNPAACNMASGMSCEETSFMLNKHNLDKDLRNVTQENVPSPVSVLDASLYQDETSTPIKRITEMFQDVTTHTSDECWNPTSLPRTPPDKASYGAYQMKAENIEALIQKLEQLTSAEDEAMCSNHPILSVPSDKDHQYIYQILSVSGILFDDLTFVAASTHAYPSRSLINPELFHVLEQMRTDSISSLEDLQENDGLSTESSVEKLHRELIFDTVNEIISKKMEQTSCTDNVRWGFQTNRLNGEQLLKDLCMEIDALQQESAEDRKLDNDDIVKSADAILQQMKAWGCPGRELQGMALEIERLIFKDLIDEIICTDSAKYVQSKRDTPRRQLF